MATRNSPISLTPDFRPFLACLLAAVFLTGCAAIQARVSGASSDTDDPSASCPVTEPVWAKPPADSAVQNEPAYGYYYINADSSIWGSAFWTDEAKDYLRAGEQGVKMGWFRPAGAELIITGRRLDAQAPPLDAEASCCYPTRFQASGLYFPTEGCWEINARAAESDLTFVVWVLPLP